MGDVVTDVVADVVTDVVADVVTDVVTDVGEVRACIRSKSEWCLSRSILSSRSIPALSVGGEGLGGASAGARVAARARYAAAAYAVEMATPSGLSDQLSIPCSSKGEHLRGGAGGGGDLLCFIGWGAPNISSVGPTGEMVR